MIIKAIALRRIFFGTLGIVAILVAAVGVTKAIRPLLPIEPGVTRENFDRVAHGMTIADVEAFLGKQEPPYDDRYGLNDGHTTMRWRWTTELAYAVIEFDSDGKVVAKEWWKNVPEEDVLTMATRIIRLRPPARSAQWRLVP